ncbi:MAG: transcription-repair coupling factor [Pontiellaceae bacterium]|jgi:transcription-repair coupling factor (superfamily II helicase)|nr:transcription-repair coupling factor [Pontiellaceae bacterium]
MDFDLTAIRSALKKEVCRLPPLPPSAQAFLGCELLRQEPRPQLWVVDHPRNMEKLADCWNTLCPGITLLTLPPFDGRDMEAQSERIKTLAFLQRDGGFASAFPLITVFQCLEEKVPTLGKPALLKTGSECAPDHFCQSLENTGYELDNEVYEKGFAARRGGIIDIWPPNSPLPVRIEFSGNEIDSLRIFDPATQRSVEKIEQVEVFPLNAKGSTPLTELLPENTLYIYSSVNAMPSSRSIHIGCVTTDTVNIDLGFYETNLKPVGGLHRPETAEQQRKLFFRTLEGMAGNGWQTDIYMETPGSADRLKEAYLPAIGGQKSAIRILAGLIHGSFIRKKARHLIITEADIYGYTAKTAHVRKKQAVQQAAGARIAEWSDIQPGELVVHVDHGIGNYMGLMEMEMAGRRQEMLLIEYADNARIYLPTGQAHLLTRYVGMGNSAPALHHLNGRRWQNERTSAESAIEDLAAKLLETQAARELKKGRACGPDTHWQNEFENSFPYMETPDQLSAIQAVKADLESTQPMDRLICGDAGYGKTEVAMRAAFKMVMEGRQVALLVPTTVLAQQHFDTFTERMAAFPVRVEMLSRFRTHPEQKETIRQLREGKAHITIGTHRLISKDVQFKELGLIIIDEEQRFGVRAKEHLKQLRKQVDVLTLSATPIPRTLYMSLTGARDMSTIQTPPQERQPVETIVLEYHDEIITEAIRHELARDGQVFYLHNRVQTIGRITAKVKELVPEARVEFAHGQMSEEALSDVMHRFVRGLFDVLICTTIVESGVDIPRVNTIIIDRADRFGLADLYQLRGRVGRARQKAYAFLLLPPGGTLSDDSRKRIEALKRYTGHGTGFRIALRDLEIRGAGNLLGAQQSGHIAAIGFDLYCQLLKRSVARLQGKKIPPIIDASVDLDFLDRSPSSPDGKNAACIPYTYVDDENLRVKLYGNISSLATETDVRELQKELTDRFGKLPAAVKNLFEIARIRIAAAQAGVQSVRANEDRIILMRNGEPLMPDGRYPRFKTLAAAARFKEILALLKTIHQKQNGLPACPPSKE